MLTSDPVLSLVSRLLSPDDAETARQWWADVGPDEDLTAFLVRHGILSAAAPIMFDLFGESAVSPEWESRLFTENARDLLCRQRRAQHLAAPAANFPAQPDSGLPTNPPPPAADTDSLLTQALLQVFSRVPEWTTMVSLVRQCWLVHRQGEEDLPAFLEQKEILSPAAPIMLNLLVEGTTADVDFARLFRSHGLQRLRDLVAAHAAEPPPAAAESANIVPATPILPGQSVEPNALSGRVLGQFHLGKLVRQEASTWVYEADDLTSDQPALVRVFQPDGVPEEQVRFLASARLASRLQHPNCVAPLDVGQAFGLAYVVEPCLELESLEQHAAKLGRLGALEAVRIVKLVAEGLAAAHASGIHHGDLSLANVFLGERGGSVRLGGFSIPERQGLTAQESVRTNLTGLGGMLYRLLTGKEPPDLRSEDGTLISPTPMLAEIHPRCAPIVQDLLANNTQPIFRSASEAVAALTLIEEVLQNANAHPTRQGRAALPPEHHGSHLLPGEMEETDPDLGPRFQIGTVLGRCLLLSVAGQGACGTVYRALHQSLNIPVAVKVIRSRHGSEELEGYQQFRTEARLLAQLNHPNVVRVWDFEDDPANPYVVMEFVEGLTVAELIAQSGKIQPDRALRIIQQTASGLQAAQKLGIVHRDIKPGNILLTRADMTVKVADLGLALVMRGSVAEAANAGMQPGGMAGTAAYMAPEQAECVTPLDHRADIYALGCTFYHMLTGNIPFSGRSRMEMILKHSTETPMPPHQVVAAVPPAFSEVVLRMMAKKPADRYRTYESLLADLQVLLQGGEVSLANRGQAVPKHESSGIHSTRVGESIWTRFFRGFKSRSAGVGGGSS